MSKFQKMFRCLSLDLDMKPQNLAVLKVFKPQNLAFSKGGDFNSNIGVRKCSAPGPIPCGSSESVLNRLSHKC